MKTKEEIRDFIKKHVVFDLPQKEPEEMERIERELVEGLVEELENEEWG